VWQQLQDWLDSTDDTDDESHLGYDDDEYGAGGAYDFLDNLFP
jgi:hypothetical protein